MIASTSMVLCALAPACDNRAALLMEAEWSVADVSRPAAMMPSLGCVDADIPRSAVESVSAAEAAPLSAEGGCAAAE